MDRKKRDERMQELETKKRLDKIPNQKRAPGEIQGFSKHLRKNAGQGRGQRVKAH